MNFSLSSLYDWYRNAIHHPKYRWWVMLGTAIYLISPIDILPDIFPVIGQIDDVMLATLLVTEVSQLILEKFKTHKEGIDLNKETAENATVEVKAETVVTEKA